MTKDQKILCGVMCIVVGLLVGIGAVRASGKDRGQTDVYDRVIDGEIDRRNNWTPGTSAQLNGPTPTSASTGSLVGCFAAMGLIGGGIWLCVEANKKTP